MQRKVVAYWHDSEGTLVAGCDDGTCWNWRHWDERWEPRIAATIPQPQPDQAAVAAAEASRRFQRGVPL